MEKLVLQIIKIGNYRFMESFFYQGEMFFDTVESFKKKDDNEERYDHHEGAIQIEQVEWIKLQDLHGRVFEFSKTGFKHIHLSSAFQLTHDDTKKGNIYSCTAVTQETKKYFLKLNPRFQKFGDVVVLIDNPNMFIERILNELNKKKI